MSFGFNLKHTHTNAVNIAVLSQLQVAAGFCFVLLTLHMN